MKRFLVLILVVVLMLSLAACSNKEANYLPSADWSDDYLAGKALNDSKLKYFEKVFSYGDGHTALNVYIQEHELYHDLKVKSDITFVEGRQLKNGDYVLVTTNISYKMCITAIRIQENRDKKIEIIELATVGKRFIE